MITPRNPLGRSSSPDDDPTGVRALLSSLPEPEPMPPELVERITASLAAEEQALTAAADRDQPDSEAGAGTRGERPSYRGVLPPPGVRPRGEREVPPHGKREAFPVPGPATGDAAVAAWGRRRRRKQVLGGITGAAAAVVVGFVALSAVQPGGGGSASTASGGSIAGQANKDGGGSGGGSGSRADGSSSGAATLDRQGSALQQEDAGGAVGRLRAVRIEHTQRNYRAATFAAQAATLAEQLSTSGATGQQSRPSQVPGAGRLDTTAGVTDCLAGLGITASARHPVVADFARYAGKPALVLVAASRAGSDRAGSDRAASGKAGSGKAGSGRNDRAWAVGRDCSADDPHVLRGPVPLR